MAVIKNLGPVDIIWLTRRWQMSYHEPTVGLLVHDRREQRRVPYVQFTQTPTKSRQSILQRFSMRKFASATIGSLLLLSSVAPALQAGTITVTEPTIGGPNGCDLVEAIHAANNDEDNDCTGTDNDPNINDADTILFATSPDTINLTTAIPSINVDHGDNGLPVITSDITINGSPGDITITRNSEDAFRILEVDGLGSSGGKLTLNKVTIHNGRASGTVYGSAASGGGLFIQNSAALTVTNSTIVSNTAKFRGGGIYAHSSSLLAMNSTVISNTALSGGGISAVISNTVIVNSSTIAANISNFNGGGIEAAISSPVIVTNNSTITANTAPRGGGIFAGMYSTVTVDSSAVVSNTAYYGGGILMFSSPVVVTNNSVIVSNNGHGIFTFFGSVTVANSSLLVNSYGALYNHIQNESPISIENSCIVGNSANAIHNGNIAITVTAQSNWWGASDGPGGALGGSGDGVSDHVDGSNFLTEPILDCPTRSSVDTVAPDEDDTPTALDEQDEPFGERIFLPVISR